MKLLDFGFGEAPKGGTLNGVLYKDELLNCVGLRRGNSIMKDSL